MSGEKITIDDDIKQVSAGVNPNNLEDIIMHRMDPTTKEHLTKTSVNSGNGNTVNVQNPLPTDGDAVYSKDIWVPGSTFANFSGTITDLFDDLHTSMVNSNAENPKTLLIHFNRTIVSNAIGLGDTSGGNFSNTKIEIVNSGDILTTVIDESASSTKYTSRTFQLPVTAGFNSLKITFHTTDTVSLTNCVVLKSRSVVARLQAAKPDMTVTDINATTGGNLKVSLEELENIISVNNNSQLRVTQYSESGAELSRSFDENNYLSKFLLNGGSEDMAVNGGTPVEFSYTVPVDKVVKLSRSLLTFEDGSVAFVPGNFGAISGALANGVEVSITPSGGSKVILETWTTNREVRNTMFDFDQEFKSDGAYVGRWTFAKDLANGGFSLTAGDKFSILIQDNLTGLDFMSFRLKGNIEDV